MRVVAESPGLSCLCERNGRSFDFASCMKPQAATLRMTDLGGCVGKAGFVQF